MITGLPADSGTATRLRAGPKRTWAGSVAGRHRPTQRTSRRTPGVAVLEIDQAGQQPCAGDQPAPAWQASRVRSGCAVADLAAIACDRAPATCTRPCRCRSGSLAHIPCRTGKGPVLRAPQATSSRWTTLAVDHLLQHPSAPARWSPSPPGLPDTTGTSPQPGRRVGEAFADARAAMNGARRSRSTRPTRAHCRSAFTGRGSTNTPGFKQVLWVEGGLHLTEDLNRSG